MAPFVYRLPRNYFPFWHIGARLAIAPVRGLLRRMRREGKGRFLDVGTGAGANCLLAAGEGFAVSACDHSRAALSELRRVARATGLDPAISYVISDACELPFRAGSFDVVVASHIIEHLDEPAGLIAECARLLTAGGVLHLSCPSRFHGGRVSRWLGLELDPPDHKVLGYAFEDLAGMLPPDLRVERVSYQGRLLEGNLADAQTLAARAFGVRAVPGSAGGAAEPWEPGLFAYLLKEILLAPAVFCCKLEDRLLPFVKGSKITAEIRKENPRE